MESRSSLPHGLRVGVDATAWGNQRGDGRFLRNAVRVLVALNPDVEWTLFVDAETGRRGFPSGARVRRVGQSRPATEALGTASARRPADLLRLSRAVRKREVDVFLSPSVYSYFPVFGVPAVVGLHDANSLTHPRLVLPLRRDRVLWRAKQAVAVRRARRLFTVSEASRTAIADRLGRPPQTIAVVPEAADPVFEPRNPDSVGAVLQQLGLSREAGYFVFAAGISPHKGVDSLLEAYARLRSKSRSVPALVVAGALEGPYASAAEAVTSRVAALGLGDRVRLPGHLPDRSLAALYSEATAAVVPSLAEGFGLPAVEAAACGSPVVASDIGPHRETLRDAALFFAPGDVAALATALGRLLDAPQIRVALGQRARAAAARLSWEETARRLDALLADVVAA